jgi:purine-binding chemotaxis protein CheW
MNDDTQPAPAHEASGAEPLPESTQYLVFQLGESLYGVEALAVRESHWLPALTTLDQTPPYIAGIANIRGTLVPVMDLAQRLGRAPGRYGARDQIVVLEHGGARIAFLVNEVRDVRAIARHQIEPHPAHRRESTAFITGVAKTGSELVMLLHLPNVLQLAGEWEHLNPVEYSNGALPSASVEDTAAGRHSLDGRPLREHSFDGQSFDRRLLDEAESAVLRERAQRLMQRDAERDFTGLVPLALVTLGGEYFGIGLEAVREFCARRQVTPVPCCPPHIVGQMNLRGDILTLIDIRSLLQLPPRSSEAGKVVVVEHDEMHVGLLIDDVLDVLYLRPTQVSEVSAGMGATGGKYFSGGALLDDRVVCLLDLCKILTEGALVVQETV